MASEVSKWSLGLVGGIVFLALGGGLFGGSFVLAIDGIRTAGIGFGVVGLVLLLVSGFKKERPEK